MECGGVQYVAEVTAASAVDPRFAVSSLWGWLVPSLQMQFSAHELKRRDAVRHRPQSRRRGVRRDLGSWAAQTLSLRPTRGRRMRLRLGNKPRRQALVGGYLGALGSVRMRRTVVLPISALYTGFWMTPCRRANSAASWTRCGWFLSRFGCRRKHSISGPRLNEIATSG